MLNNIKLGENSFWLLLRSLTVQRQEKTIIGKRIYFQGVIR